MSTGPSKSSRPGRPPRGVTRSPGQQSQAKCSDEPTSSGEPKRSRLVSIQQSAQASKLYDCIKNLLLDHAGQMPGIPAAPFVSSPPRSPFVPSTPKPPAFRGTVDTGLAASRSTPSGSSTSKKTFSAWLPDDEEESEAKESRSEGSEETGKASSSEDGGCPAEGGKALPLGGPLPKGSVAAAQMPASGQGAVGPTPSGSKPGLAGRSCPTPGSAGSMPPSVPTPGPSTPASMPSSTPPVEGSPRPGGVGMPGWRGIWNFLFPFWPIGGVIWGPFWPLPISWPRPGAPGPDAPSAGESIRPSQGPRPGPVRPGRPPRPGGVIQPWPWLPPKPGGLPGPEGGVRPGPIRPGGVIQPWPWVPPKPGGLPGPEGGVRPGPIRPGGVIQPWPWVPPKPGGLPGPEGGVRPGPIRPGGVIQPWPWVPPKPGGLPGPEGGVRPGPIRPGGVIQPWPWVPPKPGGSPPSVEGGVPLPIRPGKPPLGPSKPGDIDFPVLPVAIESRPKLPARPGKLPTWPPQIGVPSLPVKPPAIGGVLDLPPSSGGPVQPPTIGGGVLDPFWPIAGGKPPLATPSLPVHPIKPPVSGGVLEFPPPTGGPMEPPAIGGGVLDPFWPIAGGKPPLATPSLPVHPIKPPVSGGVLEFPTPPSGGPVKPPTIGGGILDPFWPIAGGKPPLVSPSLPINPIKPPVSGLLELLPPISGPIRVPPTGVREFPPADKPVKPPSIGGGLLAPIRPIIIGKPPLVTPSVPTNPIKPPPTGVKPIDPIVVGKPPLAGNVKYPRTIGHRPSPPASEDKPAILGSQPHNRAMGPALPRQLGQEAVELQDSRKGDPVTTREASVPRPPLSSPEEHGSTERRPMVKNQLPVTLEQADEQVAARNEPPRSTLSPPRDPWEQTPHETVEASEFSSGVTAPIGPVSEESKEDRSARTQSDSVSSRGSGVARDTASLANEREKPPNHHDPTPLESVPLTPEEKSVASGRKVETAALSAEPQQTEGVTPPTRRAVNPPSAEAANPSNPVEEPQSIAETPPVAAPVKTAQPVASPQGEETTNTPLPRDIQQLSGGWAVRSEESHMLRPAESPDPGPPTHNSPSVIGPRPTGDASYEGSKWRDYTGDNVDFDYTVPAIVWGKRGELDPLDAEPDLRRRAWQLSPGGQFGFGPSEVGAVSERQVGSQTAGESEDSSVKRISETKEAAQTSQSSENPLKGRGGRQKTARYSSTAKKKKSSGGGKTRVRIYRAPKKETEETEKLADGGVAGNCATCGTALPAAQAGNCPVCAQSGEDVILLTQTNYRFAGEKFFATADAVSATPEVKEIFSGETSLPLVNLKYWPKIPGHRDVLQIVREGESSPAS